MTRLRICAFGAFVITSTAAMAQDVQPGTGTGGPGAGPFTGEHVAVLIGQDKTAPLCPEFCAPRRVTAPAQATVGEREVLAHSLAAAAAGSKLHVDGRRSVWAQARKAPLSLSAEPAPALVTQGDFRPALDPVLTGPATPATPATEDPMK